MTHTWQIHRLAPAPTPTTQRPSRRGEIHHTVSLNRPTLWARWCDPNPSLSLTRRPLNQGMPTVSLSASITGKAKTAAGRWLLPHLMGVRMREAERKAGVKASVAQPSWRPVSLHWREPKEEKSIRRGHTAQSIIDQGFSFPLRAVESHRKFFEEAAWFCFE